MQHVEHEKEKKITARLKNIPFRRFGDIRADESMRSLCNQASSPSPSKKAKFYSFHHSTCTGEHETDGIESILILQTNTLLKLIMITFYSNMQIWFFTYEGVARRRNNQICSPWIRCCYSSNSSSDRNRRASERNPVSKCQVREELSDLHIKLNSKLRVQPKKGHV